ncbi:MAG: hypothetical protein M3337_08995, partial [Actinomycetota bacterium]|nr:hypothetical protein [Actinomycetota bacterium]
MIAAGQQQVHRVRREPSAMSMRQTDVPSNRTKWGRTAMAAACVALASCGRDDGAEHGSIEALLAYQSDDAGEGESRFPLSYFSFERLRDAGVLDERLGGAGAGDADAVGELYDAVDGDITTLGEPFLGSVQRLEDPDDSALWWNEASATLMDFRKATAIAGDFDVESIGDGLDADGEADGEWTMFRPGDDIQIPVSSNDLVGAQAGLVVVAAGSEDEKASTSSITGLEEGERAIDVDGVADVASRMDDAGVYAGLVVLDNEAFQT